MSTCQNNVTLFEGQAGNVNFFSRRVHVFFNVWNNKHSSPEIVFVSQGLGCIVPFLIRIQKSDLIFVMLKMILENTLEQFL